MDPTQELRNQVAFITGGSSGIGKACARHLAQLGMKIAICSRRPDKLERTAAELRAITPQVLAFPLDVTDAAAVDRGVREIEENLGPIDLLLSNAGVYRYGRVVDMSTADWDLQFDVNLKGHFLVSRAVVPSMMERKTGRLIFTSSTITLISPPDNAGYNACKRGLEAFANGIAQELIDYNINVHVLRPGFTDTDAFDEIGGKPDLEVDWIDPAELAHAVEFLCRLPKHAQVPDLTYMTTFQRRNH
jgi:NADP-dependent 3-hydroxy acid dehydrogenase YdfG